MSVLVDSERRLQAAAMWKQTMLPPEGGVPITVSFPANLLLAGIAGYFTSVLQNFSMRSKPFTMFAMLVA
jgi:hypothetical protein